MKVLDHLRDVEDFLSNTSSGLSFTGVTGLVAPLFVLLPFFSLLNRRMIFTAFIACIIACGSKAKHDINVSEDDPIIKH